MNNFKKISCTLFLMMNCALWLRPEYVAVQQNFNVDGMSVVNSIISFNFK